MGDELRDAIDHIQDRIDNKELIDYIDDVEMKLVLDDVEMKLVLDAAWRYWDLLDEEYDGY